MSYRWTTRRDYVPHSTAARPQPKHDCPVSRRPVIGLVFVADIATFAAICSQVGRTTCLAVFSSSFLCFRPQGPSPKCTWKTTRYPTEDSTALPRQTLVPTF